MSINFGSGGNTKEKVSVAADAPIVATSAAEVSKNLTHNTLTVYKSFICGKSGSIRIKGENSCSAGVPAGAVTAAYARNSVLLGYLDVNYGEAYEAFSYDVYVLAGEKVDITIKHAAGTNATCKLKDLTIGYTETDPIVFA